MKGNPAAGFIVGNGAAINISLGWYPAKVEVWNVTDGTIVTMGFLDPFVMPFSSGGTTEITAGSKIKGATSNVTAIVTDVLLSSGTWAGGDAAGFFVLDKLSGTFQSENVYIISDRVAGIDDATVTANILASMKIDTAAATVTTTNAISRYAGSSTAGVGFTIGSGIAVEAKGLRWLAWRADQNVNSA